MGAMVKSDLRHLLSAKQFRNERFRDKLLEQALTYHEILNPRRGVDVTRRKLRDYFMTGIYFKESTRTRHSFSKAAWNLGMGFDVSAGGELSDVMKGEARGHTAAFISGHNPDVLVIRSDQFGVVGEMAKWSSVPVINAGDGLEGEHPTQFFLDLFTMKLCKGFDWDFAGKPIVIGGDLQSRVVRSNVYGLAPYRPHFVFVSADQLRIPNELRRWLLDEGIGFNEESDLAPALADAQIIYWTRTQHDQRSDEQNARLREIDLYRYQVRVEDIDRTPPGCILMHPGPINREKKSGGQECVVTEIVPKLDTHPKSVYLRVQGPAAVPTRMSVLTYCCGKL